VWWSLFSSPLLDFTESIDTFFDTKNKATLSGGSF
jgi:hypothetical protein